ncbi:MAG: HDIG domain-containing protein [Acidobacteria bacterium]|nr:HDIG domain-containing protein [Acidobacteriota bacterium]
MTLPSREEAWELLCRHTQGDGLLKHALAVEIAMRAYAGKLGGDPELWGLAGLLHDFDYEAHPSQEEHPYVGANLLRAAGYPEALIRAILSHAPYTGVERVTPMERALFAVDELCGFLVACALVQPGRTLSEVKVSSVLKKLKDKHFARGVDREHIVSGAGALQVELSEHIGFVLQALQNSAGFLGLDQGISDRAG